MAAIQDGDNILRLKIDPIVVVFGVIESLYVEILSNDSHFLWI